MKTRYPNLVDYEARLAFRHFYTPEPMPAEGAGSTTSRCADVLGGVRAEAGPAAVRRSSRRGAAAPPALRIGIPRVLNLYSTAPLFRTYFEALGVPGANVSAATTTSEEMWTEGSRYGSIDPCFPSKVAQAHIHNLLFHKHAQEAARLHLLPVHHAHADVRRRHAGLDELPDRGGAPKVMRAAFTKEIDFFARAGIEYVDAAVTLLEPHYFARQMFETWGERLGVTEDESDHACREGLRALRLFDEEMERRGLEMLETAGGGARGGRPAPRPALSPRSRAPPRRPRRVPGARISGADDPLDPEGPGVAGAVLQRRLERGLITTPLSVQDVWPENYSTNSVQKVWAAKFAARHPNVVVLDLSSFKCGHDAPTYGLIDNIIKPAGRRPRRSTTSTPTSPAARSRSASRPTPTR